MDVKYFYRAFGDRLRIEREAAGLTQEELAGRVQMSRPSVANIERGNQRVALHQLVAFAAAIGVEPTVLLPQPTGLAARLGRAVQEAGLPDDVVAWGARAVERLEGERRTNDGG
ncbi:MAG: helix-turn-helix domain-containing protein [Chloroflexota bacterium]|nr:helix-turn-helix domain-containing protein [Chloroflexota bacterium]